MIDTDNRSSSLGTCSPSLGSLGERHSGPAKIPKRLIHLYCSGEKRNANLPLVCRASRASAISLNDNFEYQFFDAERMQAFVETEFPDYQAVFSSFVYPIQRFDFFRYLAIYRLGGFYLDLDIFLTKNLAALTNFACVLPFEELTLNSFLRRDLGIDWELGNYAFGACKGHPFVKAIIDGCVRGQQDTSWATKMLNGIPRPCRPQNYVTSTTGPGLITRTLAENVALQSTVTVLFPENVCDESSWHRFGDFGVHLMNSAWRKRESFIRTRLARLFEARLRKRLLRESIRLGATRTGLWHSYICAD
jgi:hypothetical protein